MKNSTLVKPLAYFVGAWLLLMVVYWPVCEAGMVGSFYGEFFQEIDGKSFYEYVFSASNKSLYWLSKVILFVGYKGWGVMAWPWHVLHITLHSFNVILLFGFLKIVFRRVGLSNPTTYALLMALIFCCSAYHTEVIVHEPCLHYLIGFALHFGGLYAFLKFLETCQKSWAVTALVATFLATFSIEYFYVTPLMMSIWWWVLQEKTATKATSVRALPVIAAMIGIVLLHFILLRAFAEVSIGHGLTDSPITIAKAYASRLPAYVFYTMGMGRFWGEGMKQSIYGMILHKPFLWVVTAVLVLLPLLVFWFWKKMTLASRVAVILSFMGMVYVLLVTPRAFLVEGIVQFDRYLYFPLAVWPSAFLLLLYPFQRRAAQLFMGLYALLNIYFLQRAIDAWKHTEQRIQRMITTYPTPQSKKDIVLNFPDHFQRVMVAPATDYHLFEVKLNQESSTLKNADIIETLSYAYFSKEPETQVESLENCRWKVSLIGQDCYWMRNHARAKSFEHSIFSVRLMDEKTYEFTLKADPKNYRVLLQQEGSWIEVQ